MRFALPVVFVLVAAADTTPITVDYPFDGATFPPGFAPPTFSWRDSGEAERWSIEIAFAGTSGWRQS